MDSDCELSLKDQKMIFDTIEKGVDEEAIMLCFSLLFTAKRPDININCTCYIDKSNRFEKTTVPFYQYVRNLVSSLHRVYSFNFQFSYYLRNICLSDTFVKFLEDNIENLQKLSNF